ncbi:MAG: hypothetical protein PVI09_22120 [Anaerolineae bacterium]|jgi:hypothetical protein
MSGMDLPLWAVPLDLRRVGVSARLGAGDHVAGHRLTLAGRVRRQVLLLR